MLMITVLKIKHLLLISMFFHYTQEISKYDYMLAEEFLKWFSYSKHSTYMAISEVINIRFLKFNLIVLLEIKVLFFAVCW